MIFSLAKKEIKKWMITHYSCKAKTFHGNFSLVQKEFYVCKECGRIFLTKKGLKIHAMKVHLKYWKNPSSREKRVPEDFISKVDLDDA